ncbi:hypothetical protein [Moorena sp. SIO4G3]|uniref:hypothetical protein n=1 Tax=Moorena sp. SIO4G3 TaxID=2607821 RepID=UPI00142B80EE|nr:hypothetical protein [Moorena sp. SIO4G3]NEO81488.1 hypothetical protein [Moorena sp. SIO4G3]
MEELRGKKNCVYHSYEKRCKFRVNLVAKEFNLLKKYKKLPVIILRSNPRDYCKTRTKIKLSYQLSA